MRNRLATVFAKQVINEHDANKLVSILRGVSIARNRDGAFVEY